MIQTLNVTDSFEFIFRNENLSALVNLKTGSIKIKKVGTTIDNLEIESLMASLISIAILHVILQPKIKNKLRSVQKIQASKPIPVQLFRNKNQNHLTMFNIIGYDEILNMQYQEMNENHHHDHQNDHNYNDNCDTYDDGSCNNWFINPQDDSNSGSSSCGGGGSSSCDGGGSSSCGGGGSSSCGGGGSSSCDGGGSSSCGGGGSSSCGGC